MNRPIRLMTATLTASAALLLTACGSGGGDDGSSDEIEGAGGGSKASASPSVKPDGAKRPEIKIPAEFQANFSGWTNSDPKAQAVLDDGKEELRAKYAAIIEGNPDSDAVAFYNSGASLTTARKWIKGFTETDDSLIGEVKAYNPKVNVNGKDTAVFFYCVDERKASTKNRKTKKVTATPDTPDSVLQYRARLTKSKQGVWQAVSLETVPGGCK
ncbi:hypothetical protein OG453_22550 [Streptomyces sp. NBC_01381]|uniref:hypothetical protein n=1 Tax=Streptomyces sp. NBC_01381 TaxID=2903845 RepID=UPI00225BA7BA|nr:hypothetical protein [Streptomyces sp. NBC_01381]MCX4669424.1 hypothetical protein [Streptomyces sp. NBC_01381]